MRPEQLGFKLVQKNLWRRPTDGGYVQLNRKWDDGEEVYTWSIAEFDSTHKRIDRIFDDWAYEDESEQVPQKIIQHNEALLSEEVDMSGDKYLRMLTEDKSAWNVDIDGTPLHVGERIIVVGPVSRKGDKGRIEEVINGFCVVDFGGTAASYQCSDVRLIPDMEDIDESTITEALDLTTVDFSRDVAVLKKYFAATPERRDGFKFDPNSGVAVVKTEEQHANFPQEVKNAIRNLVTKGVDMRFSMFEAKRLSDVETKWEPKEGFFKQSAEKIAKGLKRASKDKRQATSRLTFYINRAGKNLSAKDKKRLENAKDILHGLYEAVKRYSIDPISLKVWNSFSSDNIYYNTETDPCFTEEEFKSYVDALKGDHYDVSDIIGELEDAGIIARIEPKDMNPTQLRQVYLDPDYDDAREELTGEERFYVVMRKMTPQEIASADSAEFSEREPEEKWTPPRAPDYKSGQKVLVKYGKDKGTKGFFVKRLDNTFGLIRTTDGENKKVSFDDLAMESRKLHEAKESIKNIKNIHAFWQDPANAKKKLYFVVKDADKEDDPDAFLIGAQTYSDYKDAQFWDILDSTEEGYVKAIRLAKEYETAGKADEPDLDHVMVSFLYESKKLREAKEDIEFAKDEKVFTVKIEKTSVGSFFFTADTRNAGEAVGRVLRDESVEFVPYKKNGKFELHLNVQDFNRDQDVRKLITKLKKRATEWLIAIESGENIKKVADEAESIGNPGDIKKRLDSAVKSTKVKIDFVWPEGTVKPKPDMEEDEAPTADEKEKIDDLKESKRKKKSKTLKEADYGESFVVIEPIVDLMKGIEEKAKKHGVIFDTMEGDQSSKWKVFGKVAALESFLMDALSKSREEARQMIMGKGALHEDAGDERAAFEKENKELAARVRDWLDSMQKHYETYEYDDTDFESEFGEDADQALNIAIEENWVDVITRPGQANEYVAVDSELIEDATDIGAPTAEDVKKAKQATGI